MSVKKFPLFQVMKMAVMKNPLFQVMKMAGYEKSPVSGYENVG